MTPQCIAAVSAAAGRPITAQEAKGLEDRVRSNLRYLAQVDRQAFLGMSADQRLLEAGKLAADQILAEGAKRQQRELLTVEKTATLDSFIAAAGKRGIAPLDALKRTLEVVTDGKSNFLPVETRSNAVRDDAMRQLIGTIDATEPRFWRLIGNPEAERAIVKELFGEDSGSAIAKEGAKAFHDVAEALRQRFDRAGGEIPKREDWGLPHHHSQMRVARAGFDAWAADVMPKLDRLKYTNEDGSYMNDTQVLSFLREAYLSIATGGVNKIEPGNPAAGRSGMIAKRGNESRQIHFKDADSFIAYQADYGERSLMRVLAGHVAGVARDIAMTETYGPNPDHVFGFFRDQGIRDQALADPTKTGKLQGQATKLDNTFAYLAGRRDPIANEYVARGFDSLRQWLIAARLGSSTISAIPDEMTLHLTARVNNLPEVQLVMNELRALNPLHAEEKRLLQRAGVGLEVITGELNKWGEDQLGASFASKVSSTAMRLSGLEALDSARRRALGVTMYSALGHLAETHQRLGDLDPNDNRILLAKGITENDWQVWRLAQKETWFGNENVLSPDAIMRIPDAQLAALGDPAALREEAVTKLLGTVLEETHMGVVSPGTSEKMIAGAGLQRGTWSGEIYRSLFLFKSFPLALIRRHWMRGLGMETAGGRAAYLTSLVAGSTVLGAVAVAVNDVLSGRDPTNFGDASQKGFYRNWVGAFLKGGSMGLYGDFLFSSANKHGQNDLFGSLAGPVLGLGQEAMNVSQGNLVQFAEGRDTHFGPEAVKLLKGLTPGANNWYTKAATDHLLFQQLQEYLQPGYLSRMQARMEREFNQRFWWQPGAALSLARAPNLGRVIATQ